MKKLLLSIALILTACTANAQLFKKAVNTPQQAMCFIFQTQKGGLYINSNNTVSLSKSHTTESYSIMLSFQLPKSGRNEEISKGNKVLLKTAKGTVIELQANSSTRAKFVNCDTYTCKYKISTHVRLTADQVQILKAEGLFKARVYTDIDYAEFTLNGKKEAKASQVKRFAKLMNYCFDKLDEMKPEESKGHESNF